MDGFTGKGDRGTTDLIRTKNISKSDDRVRLLGSIDELSAHLGLVRSMMTEAGTVRFLEKLQGKWVRWSPRGYDDSLFIDGNTIGWGIHGGGEFHVISYKYRGREMNKEVYIVPADLTRDDFGGFCRVEVLPDQLHTTEMVYDMNMPLSVFAREDMIDKIEIPAGAKRPATSTMLPNDVKFDPMPADPNGLINFMGKSFPQPDIALLPKTNETKKEKAGNAGPGYCPQCAAKLNDTQKFCSECGARVRE